MNEKATLRNAVRLHTRGIKELSSVSKKYFPVLTLECIFTAITPYVTVFFSAQILKELSALKRADVLWEWVFWGILCTGITAILSAVLKQRCETLLNDLYGRKEILFIHKMFSLDFSELDKQENHDLRAQIRQNEQWASWGLMRIPNVYEDFLKGVIGVLSGVALCVTLFTLPVPESAGWLTVLNNPIFVFVIAVFMVGVSILSGKLTAGATECWSRHSEEATLGNRIFSHFGFVGYKKERAADIRMSNQEKLIDVYFRNDPAFGVNGSIAKDARGKAGISACIGVSLTTLLIGFIYVFTCLKAWGGAFDVGSITQYVGAATAMVVNILSLADLTGTLKANSIHLEKTFEFLDIPNAMYQGSLTTEKRSDRNYEIEFKDVSFKYPGSAAYALRHVNMKFKVGKRLAIVGENGSGKTTFIKLLCRLYDPDEGQILLNGIDIRKYKYDDYMNIFSVVFQDFKLISQSIASNVAGSAKYDRERVLKALTDAGLGEYIENAKHKEETVIYKSFTEDGVDVSGGEAQKIAIARALYKDAPFIILDEPTASLDPVAEAEIYSKFDKIAGDKTSIYISHRLSSCKFCDEIAVFEGGTVIEQGTHEKLLSDKEGKYHELWNAQAQYYTSDE